MDPVANPYQPGAGRRPREIAGRDRQIAAFGTALERCELGFGERGLVLSGLRGVGKTVLLNEFAALAQRRRWITAKVEASAGRSVLVPLTAALYRSLRATAHREGTQRLMSLLRVFKAFSLTVDPTGHYTFGVDVAPAVGRADSGNPDVDLAELLEDLGSTTRDLGAGTLILIDEMQDVPAEELATINGVVHTLGQAAEPLPVLVAGAGLPSLPEILAAATSYAERLYEFVELGRLDAADSHTALVKPADELGVRWEQEALEEVDRFAQGYPYFLQTAGKYAWDHAASSPITAEDARAGLAGARREVDAGLYRVRWQRATAQQRQMMRALAELGGDSPVLMADVAEAMGRGRGQVSVPRDQLIKKGLLYAPERGYVGFTVPGMAEYVLRRSE
jgi:hypothetical protein